MKKTRFFASLLSALTVVTFVAVTAARTDVPFLINYQGELKSPKTGDPVPDGSYDMVFRIFTEETRGFSLWRGTYTAANRNPVEVRNGIFNVILGSGAGNALELSVFGGAERWLEIAIEGETLLPRQRITSAAYSMVSDNSRLLDGKSASDFVISGGVVEAQKVVYSSPRIHYYSVAAEDFIPIDTPQQCEVYDDGGVYLQSAAGGLVAPLHLPHGARVTELYFFFYDGSDGRIDIQFRRVPLSGGGPQFLTSASSTGISGYDSSDGGAISHVVDNMQSSYRMYAYSSDWSSNLRIMGMVITYELEEAL